MESLGFKGRGYFGTKEEATLNIKPFRLHIEQLRKTHSASGSGGGGDSNSASHPKVYSVATHNTKLLSGHDRVVAKAGFAARKRFLGTEQPEAKKQNPPKTLQERMCAWHAEKFEQVRVAACHKVGQWRRQNMRVMYWVGWQDRMMIYLSDNIWGGGPPGISWMAARPLLTTSARTLSSLCS